MVKDNRLDDTEIFNHALDLPPEDQASYLHRACQGDAQLLRKITKLLDAYREIGSFLPADPAPHPCLPPNLPQPGACVGSYKLIRLLGEGGCGLVYLAEQQQGLRRRVALKIIRAGMDTKSVIARFEVERQALAMMDHPSIARVFEAGSSEQGRPYFVMEFVDGLKVTEYCHTHQLPIRERLNLFLQICLAVQHAHQKGIIHRDLKPSNILVTGPAGGSEQSSSHARVKIIDFGIAKATQGRLTDQTIFTALNQFIGTPAYMSPEQALITSDDIDTRSDIYSLGVLLYELLTGKPPFGNQELLTAGLDEMRRIIREVEPVRPSHCRVLQVKTEMELDPLPGKKARPPFLANARSKSLPPFPADLDWIVMKCLEKDRSRRYESAGALAADIQHLLNDEPISARPPSRGYRLRKLVRKHRIAAAGLVLSFGTMVAALITTLWALHGERTARSEADYQTRAATNFLTVVLQRVAPAISKLPGAAQAHQNLAQAGLEFIRQLRSSPRNHSALQLEIARVLLRASQTQHPGQGNTTGEFQLALEQAEEAMRILQDNSNEVSPRERAELLYDAQWSRAQTLAGLGNWEQAIHALEALEPLLSELVQVSPRPENWKEDQEHLIRMVIGGMLLDAGRVREALDRYFEPFARSELARGELNGLNETELQGVACLYDNLTDAYSRLGASEKLLPAAIRAQQVAATLARQYPANVRYTWGLAYSNAQYGYALISTGQTNSGWPILAQARKDIESIVARDIANDQFHMCRTAIAAIQSAAFAAWSQQAGLSSVESAQRISQAQSFLEEAERYRRNVKSMLVESYLTHAHSKLSAARARLEK